MGVITLGILAGGAGTRVQGRDKALLTRDGRTQLRRILDWADERDLPALLNSQHPAACYTEYGLHPVADEPAYIGRGPQAGILTLLNRCDSEFLLTLPVDAAQWPQDWDDRMSLRMHDAIDMLLCEDSDGLQPLCALWRTAPCRDALGQAARAGRWSVREWATHPRAALLPLPGWRFGNLNRTEDYDA